MNMVYFSIQMANKHIKRCSTSHIIREMKIKTTRRYHLMAVRMAAIKKSTNNKTWRGCAEKENLLHCWLECKLVQPLWITVWRFIKKKKKKLELELPSVQFSLSVVSNSLRHHGLQRARLPCPSPTSGAYTNSCPSSW